MIAKIIGSATIQMVAIVPFRSLKSVVTFCGLIAAGVRMKSAMPLAQMRARQMRINMRGRDIAMPQHLLHRAEIGAAFEQMSCERMAQRMRTDPRGARVASRPLLERLEKSLPGHRAPQPRDEYGVGPAHRGAALARTLRRLPKVGVAALQIGDQRARRRAADWNQP